MTAAEARAICAGIADHTIAHPDADQMRQMLGTAVILAIADRLPSSRDRLLLLDTWNARHYQPAR